MIKEHETGKPKGYGFVTFQVRGRSGCGQAWRDVQQPWQTGLELVCARRAQNESDVDLAISRLNGIELPNGRRIAVSRARGSRVRAGRDRDVGWLG